MTRASDRLDLKCGRKWRAMGKRFGWTLYGWNYHNNATFIDSNGHRFEVCRQVVDAIDSLDAEAAQEAAP